MKDSCEVLKAVADPTRLRIFRVLLEAKTPLCGCDFVDVLQEHHYNLSRHLKILKNMDLLREKKEGRWVFHSLKENDEKFYELLTNALSSIEDPTGIFAKDVGRLEKLLEKKKSYDH